MSNFNSLLLLLSKDNSKNKPKIIQVKNQFTKKFLEWNRKIIRQGKASYYVDPTKIYNPSSGKFINIISDRRFKNIVPRKKFVNKLIKQNPNFNYFNGQLISKSDTITETITDLDSILNRGLLRELVIKYNLTGQYRIIISFNGDIVSDRIENITMPLYKWYDSIFYDYIRDSEYMKWQIRAKKKYLIPTFTFSKDSTISPKYFKQYYLDGVSHCFFTPILEWCDDMIKKVKSDSSKKKYLAIKNKVIGKTLKNGDIKDSYLKKYEQGISGEDIPIICDDLQIGIEITQPFNQNTFLRCLSQKSSLKVFKFINTRLNHLELNQEGINTLFTNDYKNIEIVDRNKLIKLKTQLINNKEFFIFTKDNYGINSIKTLSKHYSLENDFMDTINQFESETGLKNTKIDALKFPKLQKFINYGCHWNGTTDFKDVSKININDVDHIDETKAYTQFRNCKYYNGFLGKITDFRKVDNYNQKGYYYITNLDLSNCSNKFQYYNENLKWFINNNIYTDSELKFLEEQNGKFKVLVGAYGIKLDFEFNSKMTDTIDIVSINDKTFKVPYYSKWVGICGSIKESKNIFMSGDKTYFEAIKSNGYDMYYSNWDKEARISYKKKHLFNNRHIAGQITAYQRLNLMEQLLNMDEKKIVRVCVDGIYYYPHKCDIIKTFGDKKKKTFNNSHCDKYLSHILEENNDKYNLCDENKLRDFYMKELFTGIGGSGKTHINIIDRGLINVCYIAPSWKLSSAKVKEYYNIDTFDNSVLHRILSRPHNVELCNKYNVYIFDECSQYTEYQKQQIFNTVNGKIIFCGDLGYQLPPVIDNGLKELARKNNDNSYITEMNNKDFDNHRHFEKSFRCKCDKLEKVSIYLRELIKSGSDSFNNDVKDKLNLQKISINDLKNIYSKEDMILASEHELKDKYTKLFDHIEKYRVLNNTRDYSNGEIIYKEVDKVKTEKQHAFTVHSIQGETSDNNLYIDFTKFKSIRMLYTAISRARYFNQIYEIN